MFIPGLDTHAQKAALHFTGHHGQVAQPADISAGIGAAGNIAPPDIGPLHAGTGIHLLHLLTAPLLYVCAQGRTGGAQCAYRVQALDLSQRHTGFHAIGIKRRTAAEKGDALGGGKAPEQAPIRVFFGAARVAVVNHASGTAHQAADLHVPHDPAGGRIPEKALAPSVGLVTAANIAMQVFVYLQVEHGAAMAVYQRLGQAGGTAGIHNP